MGLGGKCENSDEVPLKGPTLIIIKRGSSTETLLGLEPNGKGADGAEYLVGEDARNIFNTSIKPGLASGDPGST